jgi:hypothetical protein
MLDDLQDLQAQMETNTSYPMSISTYSISL